MGRQSIKLITGGLCLLLAIIFLSAPSALAQNNSASPKISNLFNASPFNDALGDQSTRPNALHKVFIETAFQNAAPNACTILPPDQAYVEEMLVRFEGDGAQNFERRVALVVGNSAYENGIGALKNPANDANSMARALRALGFTVHVGLDLDAVKLEQCISGFEQDLSNTRADIALFFYAGHGVQLVSEADNEKRNYMLATDAAVSAAGEGVGFMQIDAVLSGMREQSEQSVFFYDACRNDPLGDGKPAMIDGMAIERAAFSLSGAAAVDVKESAAEDRAGIFIAYATAPNRVADDAYEIGADHSPFTRALLNHIATPGISLKQAMSYVSNDVGELTEWNQTPWTSSSLTEDLQLNGAVEARELLSRSRDLASVAATAQAEGLRGNALRAALTAMPGDWREGDALFFNAQAALFQAFRATDVNLEGHDGNVWRAAFSPDGRTVVTASKDKTAKLWDASTGLEIATLKGHTNEVWSASFSPDGSKIVTTAIDTETFLATDFSVRVWNAADGALLSTLIGHQAEVASASFSPDSKRIVTRSFDGVVKIWDAATGNELATLPGAAQQDGAKYSAAAFTSDGEQVATLSDKRIYLWSGSTGAPVSKREMTINGSAHAVFSPDGKRFATRSRGTAKVWSIETGVVLATLDFVEARVDELMFSPDSARLATKNDAMEIKIWDIATGALVSSFKSDAGFESWRFSPDGDAIAVGAYGTTRLWRVEDGAELLTLPPVESDTLSIDFSPDGARILTSSSDQIARIRSTKQAEPLVELSPNFDSETDIFHGDRIHAAAFNAAASEVVTASADLTAIIWDAVTGDMRQIFSGHSDQVWDASFSPDGRAVVTASMDGTLRLWDKSTGEELATLRAHTAAVLSAEFNADGGRIVSASEDGSAIIWNYDEGTGEWLSAITLSDHGGPVTDAAFSPNGAYVATASSDGLARIWNAASGDLITTVEGHEDVIRSVDYSPEGDRILTASDDSTARIFDTATGQELQRLDHLFGVGNAYFDPEGARVVTTNGVVNIWHAAAETQLMTIRFIPTTNAVFSPDGTRIAATTEASQAAIWDVGLWGQPLIDAANGQLSDEMRLDVERARIRYWEVNEELLQ